MMRGIAIGLLAAVLVWAAPSAAAAQAQAANGNIEGTVKDSSGAALPGVTVTVTNMDTGTHARRRSPTKMASTARRSCRSAATRWRRSCQGFKTFEQQGITLSAGQTAAHQRRR